MKKHYYSFLTPFFCLLLMAVSSGTPPVPAIGNLYITQIPGAAADLEMVFSQPGATTLNVLGSQLGYAQGDGTVTIPAETGARHFGNAGFDPNKEFSVEISLLDETGDVIAEPAPAQGSFMLNQSGPTVINLSSL